MACGRAAELLSLSIRQIKRLEKHLREQGKAALAHANRGRPSSRRLPTRVRQNIVRLARTTYAGFSPQPESQRPRRTLWRLLKIALCMRICAWH